MTDDARAYALRLLSQRSYTERDLRQKLAHKEFPSEAIEGAIERFIESGLVDDKKFALNFARAKLAGTGASRRSIQQKLAKKGIPRALADAAVDRVIEDEGIDASASLERLARKKMATFAGLERQVARRRLFGFLARRGYDLDEIRRIVEKLTSV